MESDASHRYSIQTIPPPPLPSRATSASTQYLPCMSRSGLHWTSGASAREDVIDSSDEDIDTKPTGPSFGRTLAQVLEDGSNVTGAFSCMQTHVLAPNPGLQVDDIGTLGLPLSVREAAAFKACAEYAATANRDASANEKHCWEVEARKVHFGNNEWTTFIDATFRQVCDNFAICSKINKSRYEFRRLALYETGYSLLPPRRQRGDEGVFATVVVILPSKFSGGSVCVAHDNREETYDCSPGSLTNTTVLAWFDECTLEAQPLTGGFQLALHFDLIHTTETPQPSLSGQDCIVSRLRDIFSTWNSERGSSDTPKKIVCLLQDKHPGESLAHASLSGTDARSVLLLSNVGKLHGFRVGLATLICTERGLGELERGYYGDDDWIEGANDVSMVEVDDRDVAITRLVSLDGRLICASLEHDLKREAIPAHMLKLITAERPDKQMYAYVNSKHMSFKQVFRRTVAVVWPQWAEFELVHGPYGFLDACKRLRACNNTQPTAEDSELVEGILARTDESTNEAVMESVCRVALLWDDFPLWLRTVKACDAEQSISAVGEENIYRAVSVFGFQQVRECLQRMLQRDPSDVDALQFLEDFKEWASEQDAPEQSATMNHWIAAQRTKRIASLRGPIERDYEALVKLIIEHGDADELESQVVPYLISSANKLVLAQCVNLLAGEGFTLKHLVDARARITGVLLATVHPNINFRPMLTSEEAADNEDLLELLQLYMKGCMAMDRHDLLSLAWPRLRDVSGLSRFEISSHVGHTLFPLISHVAEVAPAAYRPEVSALCETAVSYWLMTFADPGVPELTEKLVLSMLWAVSASKKTSLLGACIVPRFEEKADEVQLRILLDGLHTKRSTLGPNCDTLLLTLVKRWVVITEQPLSSPEAIGYVMSFDLPEACSFLFHTLLNPSVLDKAYVKNQLATLLRSICSSLAARKLSVSSSHFAPTLRAIMRQWAEKVMSPPPTHEAFRPLTVLAGWRCACKHCTPVRDFLMHSSEETWTGRIGRQNVNHVVAQLGNHAQSAAVWQGLPSRKNGEALGLEVKKDRSIVVASQWRHGQSTGLELLRAISRDEGELQAILGEDYHFIVASLEEPKHSAYAAPARAQSAQVARTVEARGLTSGGRKSQGTASNNGEQQKVRRGDTIAGPPAKRRKTAYNENDVIDLT